MTDVKNAVVNSATITNEDHGILTAWLSLDYGGTGQRFGGCSLYLPKPLKEYGCFGFASTSNHS